MYHNNGTMLAKGRNDSDCPCIPFHGIMLAESSVNPCIPLLEPFAALLTMQGVTEPFPSMIPCLQRRTSLGSPWLIAY